MQKTIGLLAALLVVSLFAMPAPAQRAEDYKRMPWHLADIWWDFGEATTFESFEIDVTIEGEIGDDVNLYIAPFGLSQLGESRFYGGIQTHTLAQMKDNPRRRDLGRGGIFSMWGERSHDAIRTGPGGFMESSGHEGDFISVRREIEWGEGRYTFRIVKQRVEYIDGAAYTWVAYTIYSHEDDVETFCGALRFPGEDLQLGRRNAGFIELYGRRPQSLDVIPDVAITFHNPVVNGRAIERPTALAVYDQGVPDYVVAEGVVDEETGSHDIRFEVGQEVDRDSRREELFE